MNAPSSLDQFPKISVLPRTSLVNGSLQIASGLPNEASREARFRSVGGRSGRDGRGADDVDLSDILKRLLALEDRMKIVEDRLDAASITAACNSGNVTVTLNL
jgi:hypothetical protein